MTTCASPAYLDQHGTPETMDELQQHQAVNWINSSNRQVMPRHSGRQRAPPKLNFRAGLSWITQKPTLQQAWRGWEYYRA